MTFRMDAGRVTAYTTVQRIIMSSKTFRISVLGIEIPYPHVRGIVLRCPAISTLLSFWITQ